MRKQISFYEKSPFPSASYVCSLRLSLLLSTSSPNSKIECLYCRLENLIMFHIYARAFELASLILLFAYFCPPMTQVMRSSPQHSLCNTTFTSSSLSLSLFLYVSVCVCVCLSLSLCNSLLFHNIVSVSLPTTLTPRSLQVTARRCGKKQRMSRTLPTP